MRIEIESFYYFSDEYVDNVFPVECRFIKWLNVLNSSCVAMKACSGVPFGKSMLNEFIILPRGGEWFDVPERDIFPVFIFEMDGRVRGDTLDLCEGLKHVKDRGCICFSLDFAKSNVLTS